MKTFCPRELCPDPREVHCHERTAYTDGACRVTNPGVCSAAWAIFVDGLLEDCDAWPLEGLQTNNQAEYAGLVGLLTWLDQQGIGPFTIHCDSKLVVSQVNGLWKVRDALVEPCERARELMKLGGHTLIHVKGHAGIEGNEYVDGLCNEVLDEVMAKEKVSA